MFDYESCYESYFEIFMREKESREEDRWYASCYCAKLLSLFLWDILKIDYESESEKFERIKALNDAYQNTFPPDEA